MTTGDILFCAALAVLVVTCTAILQVRRARWERDAQERKASADRERARELADELRAARARERRRSVIEALADGRDDEQDADLLETLQHNA